MRPGHDLLHVLARDHRRLDDRCRTLLAEPDRRTVRAVAGLATDVIAHEASEQLLLHPLVTARVPSGPRLARHRTEEEAALERQLQTALREEVGSPRFHARFEVFHRTFIEHTDREELEVFPALRHVVSRRELRDLGRAYATLTTRLPTRLRVVAGSRGDGEPTDRLLADAREVAGEILEEVDASPVLTIPDAVAPSGSSVGRRRGPELAGR